MNTFKRLIFVDINKYVLVATFSIILLTLSYSPMFAADVIIDEISSTKLTVNTPFITYINTAPDRWTLTVPPFFFSVGEKVAFTEPGIVPPGELPHVNLFTVINPSTITLQSDIINSDPSIPTYPDGTKVVVSPTINLTFNDLSAEVPEPTTLAILSSSLIGVMIKGYRSRKA